MLCNKQIKKRGAEGRDLVGQQYQAGDNDGEALAVKFLLFYLACDLNKNLLKWKK